MRPEPQRPVRFLLDGEVRTLDNVDPTRTVLQYLREDLLRTGTKEGCAEGDCGACTVVVASLNGDVVRYQAINSCIRFLPTLDGKALFTVESLSPPRAPLHPVQQAMVECHGSQCGFCTPGFVMSLYALYKSGPCPGRRGIDDALSGNLCRCTGYRPIVAAARRMYELADQAVEDPSPDAPAAKPDPRDRALVEKLRAIRPADTLSLGGPGRSYYAPVRLDALLSLSARHPGAILLAGGTDVGLRVTKQHRELGTIIHTGEVEELHILAGTASHIEIGAAVSLADAFPAILAEYPELEELFLRFASPPIRNSGTVGGNIANGSPIGDTMPALIALGADIVLSSTHGSRILPLEEFYLDYQRNDRRSGEVLERILLPRRDQHTLVACYKISKRFDQDISAVCAAFALRLQEGRVETLRTGFGGVAAVPARAVTCERALAGKTWGETAVQAGMAALDRDFSPMSDMRASEAYRRRVTRNLLYRFYLQTTAGDEGGYQQLYGYGR